MKHGGRLKATVPEKGWEHSCLGKPTYPFLVSFNFALFRQEMAGVEC